MNIPRLIRFACAALFAGTTACSLVLSASSTMDKAANSHVPGAILWSSVGVLELVSLAGTLRWLTASTIRGRRHAVVIVSAAAAVTGFAGWAAYGWFGLVAPIAVVATIHMVSETLSDPGVVTETTESTNADVVQAPDLHTVRTIATDSLSEMIEGKRDDVWRAAKALHVKRESGELLGTLRARCRTALEAKTTTDPDQLEA